MKTKGVDRSAAKWTENTSNATGSYQDGVQNPKADWATATKAAEPNYKAGVAKAAADGSFGKGVQRVGTAKQQQNSLTKGVSRFAQGVAGAASDYAEGMAPYIDVLERTQLPPRGPKGDIKNIKRVEMIATALHAAKNARR